MTGSDRKPPSKAPTELRVSSYFKPDDCAGARRVKPGDHIEIDFVAKLSDGTVFESTLNDAQAFDFQVSKGEVIPGLDRGVLGMCVGEKRMLEVPPGHAYKSDKKSSLGVEIPYTGTQMYDVKLNSVRDEEKGPAPQVHYSLAALSLSLSLSLSLTCLSLLFAF